MDFWCDAKHNGGDVDLYLALIRERYGCICPNDNLLCQTCPDSVPVCFFNNRYPKWCLSLGCSLPECSRRWHTCFLCSVNQKFIRRNELERHDKMHAQWQDEEDDEAIDRNGDSAAAASTDEDIADRLRDYFPEQREWATFFLHHRNGKALKYLVANQFLDSPEPSDITTSDAELHVLIASLCENLTKGERMQLAEIFRRIYEKSNLERNKTSPGISCKIPESRLELLRYVDGKKSIMENIPVPKIYTASNGDAYVRLPEALQLYLCFGLKPSTVRLINETGPVGRDGVTDTIWNCPHARKQLQSLAHRNANSNKAALVKWSDGCDSNCSSKGNRGSVHVCTVTLFSGDNNNSKFTFLIHVGREDSSHYEVNRILLNDLKSLQIPTCYYDGDSFDNYQFLEFATIHDRPELSKECGYGYHSGTFTPRFPHSCPVTDDLASCESCFDRRLRLRTSWKSNNACKECNDWDFDGIEFASPKNYPGDETETSRQLTFEDMLSAATTAHNMLVSQQWTQGSALAYLQVWGINGNVASDVVENSQKETPKELSEVVPPIWTEDGATERYIAAVMHMVFLGVTKTIGTMVRDLLCMYSRAWPEFFSHVQKYLEILRGYSLSYCRIWTFGSHDKPYSPWVSENHLAHARCFKMAYSFLSCIKRENNEERDESVRLMQTATNSWVAVVARLMQKPSDKHNNNSAERHIKLFLSNLNDLDSHIMQKQEESTRKKKQKKRKIQTVTNLVGLLNLPNQMRAFGNLRDYWEGSYRGEGILREIKSYITQGTHQPWFAKATLRRFYRTKTMSMMLDGDFFEADDNSNDECVLQYSDYYRYSNIDSLQQCISKGEPISGIVLNDGTVCCAVGRNRRIEFYNIDFNDDNSKWICATYYCLLQLGGTVEIESSGDGNNNLRKQMNQHIDNYVVMLPYLDESVGVTHNDDGDHFHYYYVTDSSWKERKCVNGVTTYELPIVENAQY